MEQVLDTYEQPYDSRRPVVCFDERPCQLLGDVLMPIPMKPGRVERQDYHYERHCQDNVSLKSQNKELRKIMPNL